MLPVRSVRREMNPIDSHSQKFQLVEHKEDENGGDPAR
jgi:hypothetical protein